MMDDRSAAVNVIEHLASSMLDTPRTQILEAGADVPSTFRVGIVLLFVTSSFPGNQVYFASNIGQ
jgi:hypothetical protein